MERVIENLRHNEEGYASRTIIVWAHNANWMNTYYGAQVNSIHIEPQATPHCPESETQFPKPNFQ